MAASLTDLCFKLAHDADADVKSIGRRCLRAYDEFVGLRYAGLTEHDVGQLAAAAQAARTHGDAVRAGLLDEALRVVRAVLGG
jgi:hypothetical protein